MRTRLLPLLFAIVVESFAQALDRIDAQLTEKLRSYPDDAIVKVIIVMKDQVDVEAMRQAFVAARAPKEVRHYHVVTALQQKAAATQSGIMSSLARQQASGDVQHFESMWLVNMVLATATKRAIMELAVREDVGMIYEDGLLALDAPVASAPASSSPGAAEPNLRAINAHRLWELGYTGQGTLVMNIDTGVNGAHPGLASRWRGNQPGVPWYHAWYDQKVPPSPVPVDYGSTKHGSHTMGIMTGLDGATADTFGVAFGAQWIASPTIDVGFSPHTSYTLRAFQWAADPDSNPSTANDVPDVISNSYQDPNVSSTQCNGASGYWGVVDALEAIGTAVVWSAGNAGSAPQSITPPKNRITTNVNFFAVGNLNTSTAPPWVISNSSSRGPSLCDGVTIKPEVCAPGTSIRSSLAGNTYGLLSGTSMAAPHVAGALAVLRSANPSYTCSDVKEILLNTAVDYGPAGEDNTYGMGLIDMWAAFQQISVALPRVQGVVTGSAGDTLDDVRVQNVTTGVAVQTNARGFFRFVLPDTGVYRIRFEKLGFASREDTVHAAEDSTTYVLEVTLQQLPAPSIAVDPSSFTLNLRQGDSLMQSLRVSNTGPAPSQLAYRVSINGGIGGLLEERVGAATSSFNNSAFVRGNRYLATRRTRLKEIKSYHVIAASTELRFVVYESATPTGSFTRIYDGQPVISGTGTGFFSSGPIDVQLDSGKYYLIGAGWQGTVTYYNTASTPTPVGFGTALSGFSASGYPPPAAITISSTTTAFYYGAIVTTSGKFLSVSNAFGDTLSGGSWNDHTLTITTAALEPAGSPYTAEIVVASNDTSRATVLVPVTLTILTGAGEEPSAPVQFALHPNYPNPFNPTTTIKFQIPNLEPKMRVTLKVFDLLGRELRTLVDETLQAGSYETTIHSDGLASGVYFYRLTAPGYIATRRMMIVK